MNIVYVYYNHPLDQNSIHWQCTVPAKAINSTKRHSANLLPMEDFVKNSSKAQLLCEAADVIVIHRRLTESILAAVQKWKAHDKTILLNMDISIQHLTQDMGDYAFWYQGIANSENGSQIFGDEPLDPVPNEVLSWGLRLLDGIVTSSERIVDDLKNTIPTALVPCFIEVDQYRKQTPIVHQDILIGIGGDANSFPGIEQSGVLKALTNVIKKRSQARVVVLGGDKRVYEGIPIANERKVIWPYIKYEEWPRYLSRLDIGLAPRGGDFDMRRCNGRILEYMVMKIPWVGSDCPVFRKIADYGWVVPNHPAAWEQVILEMIDHYPDYRTEAAGEPYLFGLSNDIDENINKILMAYEKMRP